MHQNWFGINGKLAIWITLILILQLLVNYYFGFALQSGFILPIASPLTYIFNSQVNDLDPFRITGFYLLTASIVQFAVDRFLPKLNSQKWTKYVTLVGLFTPYLAGFSIPIYLLIVVAQLVFVLSCLFEAILHRSESLARSSEAVFPTVLVDFLVIVNLIVLLRWFGFIWLAG
jgi:hypothetical protein